MRYVIVDMDGASREYFSRRSDVREALLELEQEHAGIANELLVVRYDEDGLRVGEPESSFDVLRHEVLDGSATGVLVIGQAAVLQATWTVAKQVAPSSAPWLAEAAQAPKTEPLTSACAS